PALATPSRNRAIGAVTPALKIGMLLLACAMRALAGCDLAEQAASFMPKTSRQAGPEPAPPNPEPDAKELVRANADTLFTAHRTALAVSPPKSITGRGYSVCVKAVVAGPMDPAPQPITVFVIIACSFEVNAESGTRRMRWTILTRARLRIGKPDQRHISASRLRRLERRVVNVAGVVIARHTHESGGPP